MAILDLITSHAELAIGAAVVLVVIGLRSPKLAGQLLLALIILMGLVYVAEFFWELGSTGIDNAGKLKGGLRTDL